MIMRNVIFVSMFMLSGLVCADTALGQNTSPNSNTTEQERDGDVPLKIIKKPQAKTEGKCRRMSEGRTRVRTTFDKSGKVTDAVIVVPSGCDTFDRNAVDAATRIEFKPAIKNGEAVTTIRQIEYKYRIY